MKYLWTAAGTLIGLVLGSGLGLVIVVLALQLGVAQDNIILRLMAQVLGVGGMLYGGYRGWLSAGGLSRRVSN